MARLDGKVALISGGACGQGAEEARLFLQAGARVIIGDLQHGPGQTLAKELGNAACYIPLDVTRQGDWEQAIAMIETEFSSLDILVNNAGLLRRASIESCTVEDFTRLFEVNQLGVFLGMKATVRRMKRDGGSIINISSTAGLKAAADHVAYVGSKYAIRGMTKVAAIEFARYNIRVNSVHPGLVDTAMVRDRFDDSQMKQFTAHQLVDRPGTVRDVANMVLFLASDDSGYCTGAEFICDGGYTAGSR